MSMIVIAASRCNHVAINTAYHAVNKWLNLVAAYTITDTVIIIAVVILNHDCNKYSGIYSIQ